MASYHTQQYETLLTFLKAGTQTQYTSDDIIQAVCADGKLGRSTAYRLIGRMTEEGLLRKFHKDKHVYYQFVEEHDHCSDHFHLKCSGCGKLVHLDCHMMDALQSHILDKHGFSLSPAQTVLYGLCDHCERRLAHDET